MTTAHPRSSPPRHRRTPAQQPLARILAIGDELLLGRTIDSNSAHLARWCTDRGLRVAGVRQVSDSLADILAALRDASADAALVLTTGGLGPTDDDRTRAALAALAGVPLQFRPAQWRAIQRWFARVRPGLAVPERNRVQAEQPRGAIAIPNPRGTAPGVLMTYRPRRVPGKTRAHQHCHIASLPGVPPEMEGMLAFLDRRLPRLVPGLRRPAIGEVYFAGLGESAAQERCDGLFTESAPRVGITVSELGHITVRAVGTAAEVRARCAAVRERLAGYVLPAAGLAPSLIAELTARGYQISAAESCTGGHIAALLTSVPGASAVLRQSCVTYHEDAKRSLLEVDPDLIAKTGVVSRGVALAMAAGCRAWSGADIAIASTGLAGPAPEGDSGSAALPMGTVFVACASPAGVHVRRLLLTGNRDRIQRRAAVAAIQLAYDVLHDRVEGAAPTTPG